MKKLTMISLFSLSLVLAVAISACGGAVLGNQETEEPVASAPVGDNTIVENDQLADEKDELMVYRGTVDEIQEDGSILVRQLDGYSYGHDSILFHVGEDTILTETDAPLAEDAYVEVTYGGALTASLPAQGNAATITVLAPQSEGIVQNGVVKTVEQDENGDYRIAILPFDAAEDTFESQVILLVPKDAFEGIEAGDVVEGFEVSAVTRGIAAMSLPPQMPVIVLMPYSV